MKAIDPKTNLSGKKINQKVNYFLILKLIDLKMNQMKPFS